MKIEQDIISYLSGEKFRNNLVFKIDKQKQDDITRESAIIRLIRNKSVIHIGCSDHVPIIDEKIRQNTWLHKLITEAASECVGIDIDPKSIKYIREKTGFNNVFQGDILNDDLAVLKEKVRDYAVFGEIIEHLDNPVDFLQKYKSNYGKFTRRFIITVPNVFNRMQFDNMLAYKEIINSDHRFWFTPFTISKVLMEGGFKPEEITFAGCQKLSVPELVKRKIKKTLGIQISFPYYYFKNLVISGTLD